MRLLPDLFVDGKKISLQHPYTLNGKIISRIVKLEIDGIYIFNCYDDAHIGYCYSYSVDENDFEIEFSRKYAEYVRLFGTTYIDYDECNHTISFGSFESYIERIKEQCSVIDRSGTFATSRIQNHLFSQRRSLANISVVRDNHDISSNIDFVDVRSISFDPSPTKSNQYIHSWNFTPEFIHHYMPGENPNTTLLLGAEIEVAGNTNERISRNDVVKKCIQIMNGSESDKEEFIYSTSDSTVQIELDTMPSSLEFHKNKMNYKELFNYLDSLGYKGHDCDSAGLHIHANRSYLGPTPLLQQLTISKILYIIEKFNDEICVLARRNNGYSQFVGAKKDENSVVELYGRYQNYGKKAALNLRHQDTIEFRMFKSTLKVETFLLTLEFVKDIIDFAKQVNVEEIESIRWEDLMSTFSLELKKYYNVRLNKAKKKEADSDVSNRIKELKKKISDIKTLLKHAVNFLQQSNLQSEMNALQKELAVLQKKENKEKKKKKNTIYLTSADISDARILAFEGWGPPSQISRGQRSTMSFSAGRLDFLGYDTLWGN